MLSRLYENYGRMDVVLFLWGFERWQGRFGWCEAVGLPEGWLEWLAVWLWPCRI
jgi:hypothetical protein